MAGEEVAPTPTPQEASAARPPDRPVVLPLRCPGCGGSLCGLPQDLVFWCRECAGLQELVGTAFVAREGATARAVRPGRGLLRHLPLWAFRVEAEWDWPEQVCESALVRQLAQPEWVYVTGFRLHNAFYLGDPGLIFTQRQVSLEAADPAPLLGCSRSLAAATAFVEPHLLSIVDRRVDVTGIVLATRIGQAVLWGIPVYDDGAVLSDGILGLEFPAAAVDQIGALRGWKDGGR